MRAFIAIEISDDIRKQIEAVRSRLAESRADVKWVEPENLHLTLKFLGEIDPKLVPQVADAMREAVAGEEAFELSIGGVGSFPAAGAPRVVWLGIQDGSGVVPPLVERLEKLLAKLGIPPEGRKFTPHLTLGRLRSRKGAERLVELLRSMPKPELGSEVVDRLLLFESRLTQEGALHTVVATQKLGA